MTELPPPPSPNPRPISRAPLPFTWSSFIGALLLSTGTGVFLNLISGLIASVTGNVIVGLLIGAIPGALWVWYGTTKRPLEPGFGNGLIVGGCIVALVGGACGTAMTGGKFGG